MPPSLRPSMNAPSPSVLFANHHPDPADEPVVALRAAGYRVAVTENLQATVARLAESSWDLVVLRPLVGRAGGFEATAITRHAPATPCLLLLESAEGFPDRPAARAGDDFLVGQLRMDELLGRVSLALDRKQHLEAMQQQELLLKRQTTTDFKTGLYNDRYFYQRLAEEIQRARRHDHVISVILMDLDDFKTINDQHDHLFGDFVLFEFSQKLRTITRQIDIPARLGGDEFGLLLPNTDMRDAASLARRLQDQLAAKPLAKDGNQHQLAVSMGIHSARGEATEPAKQFVQRADLALLAAKRKGKGRICLSIEIDDKSMTAGA